MFNSINPSADQFLNAMAQLNDRMDVLERQISSGKRLEVPSDAPDEVSPVLTIRAEVARIDQVTSNLGLVKTEVDTAESSVSAAVSLFDQVRTLGADGANGVQTATTRQSIASQIASLENRMVALANTEVNGRFIFSGDSDQTMPYSLDMTQTPPFSAYAGSTSTRQVVDASGVQYPIAETAQDIFDNSDPTKNVFQAMETLRQALLANDSTAIQNAIDPLAGVSEHLNSMLSFYGNVQDQVASSTDSAASLKLSLQTQLSQDEDADLASATVELQQLKFQQDAAFQVRAALPNVSLFDYLKGSGGA